jgi:SAM-dependent methyltransferase
MSVVDQQEMPVGDEAREDVAVKEQLGGASWRVSGSEIDVSVAHPARRYDYWLGGKDNFAADRVSGDAVAALFPTIREAIRENRRFLGRTVRFLAEELGIDQFLDIGTGIPAADNTHEVAQRVNPEACVVYVDNDPIVLAYARALLTGNRPGSTAYIDADLRRPQGILDHPALTATLDLSRPVGLMLVSVLHFLQDDDDPHGVVRHLLSALVPGSCLVVSHGTNDLVDPCDRAALERVAADNKAGFRMRSMEEFGRFFDGLELVPPGVVSIADWRADAAPELRPTPAQVSMYGAVGRIPA